MIIISKAHIFIWLGNDEIGMMVACGLTIQTIIIPLFQNKGIVHRSCKEGEKEGVRRLIARLLSLSFVVFIIWLAGGFNQQQRRFGSPKNYFALSPHDIVSAHILSGSK